MLIKARFVAQLHKPNELDFRYLFALSLEDAYLLGVVDRDGETLPSGREITKFDRPPRFTRSMPLESMETTEELTPAEMQRVFVAETPFPLDRPEVASAQTQQNPALTLVPGRTFWLMVQGPFGALEPGRTPGNGFVLDMQRTPLNGARALRVNIAAGYDVLSAEALLAVANESVEVSPGMEEGVNPFRRLIADREMEDESLEEPITDTEAEMLQRMAGAVLSMPITDAIMHDGIERYRAEEATNIAQGLIPLYRHWAASHLKDGQRSSRRGQRGPLPPGQSPNLFRGQPMLESVSDLSNPHEYGADGRFFLARCIANPYAYVGPASSPGVGPLREGGGIAMGLPFWAMDILAQAIYSPARFGAWQPESAYPEPLYRDRSQSVAVETFRHLEARNSRAFQRYLPTGRVDASSGDFQFDLDAGPGFASPAGSTVFSRQAVDQGLVLRMRDLDRMISRESVAFFGDSIWQNPFQAYAGYISSRMYRLRYMERRDNRDLTVEEVATMANHPLQVEDGSPAVANYEFRSLQKRSEVEEALARRVLAGTLWQGIPKIYDRDDLSGRESQEWEPGIIDVEAPTIRMPDQDAPSDALTVTPSQAEAFLLTSRWPLVAITGEPGSGKTHALRVIYRMLDRCTAGRGWFLVLAPTNRAAARLAERLESMLPAGQRLMLLGDTKTPQEGLDRFRIAVGTVDSFISRMQTSIRFRSSIYNRDGFLATDECSMVTNDRFNTVMNYLDPRDAQGLRVDLEGRPGRLLRAILVGDAYQLASVEPGNFFHDMMRFVPTIKLREQVRSAAGGDRVTEEGEEGLGLEALFRLVRSSMDHPQDRLLVVRYLLAHALGEDVETSDHKLLVEGTLDREVAKDAYEKAGIVSAREEFRERKLDEVKAQGTDYTRVVLVNDLPQPETHFRGPLPTESEYRNFQIFELNESARKAVFRSILQWRGITFREVLQDPSFTRSGVPPEVRNVVDELSNRLNDPYADPIPYMPAEYAEVGGELGRRIRFIYQFAYSQVMRAFTAREPSFKVITMYRVRSSVTARTDYISSSDRVNGWFHDFLLKIRQPPPGYVLPPTPPDLRHSVRGDEFFFRTHQAIQKHGFDPRSDNEAELIPREDEELKYTFTERFLYEERPEQLTLCPNWPYIVRRNEFRRFGVFRGETVYYLGAAHSGGRSNYRFVSEAGHEMFLGQRFVQKKYLTYGWATNVHQVQGGEYPLIVMLWMAGVPYGGERGLQQNWEEIRPTDSFAGEMQRMTQPILQDGMDGDRMDIRAFYTGITRTKAHWRLPIPDPRTGATYQTGKGQCVIVTGMHALRQYLSLQVQERATGFAGQMLNLLQTQEGTA